MADNVIEHDLNKHSHSDKNSVMQKDENGLASRYTHNLYTHLCYSRQYYSKYQLIYPGFLSILLMVNTPQHHCIDLCTHQSALPCVAMLFRLPNEHAFDYVEFFFK